MVLREPTVGEGSRDAAALTSVLTLSGFTSVEAIAEGVREAIMPLYLSLFGAQEQQHKYSAPEPRSKMCFGSNLVLSYLFILAYYCSNLVLACARQGRCLNHAGR